MDWIWVAVCLFGLAAYLWAFITLARRGDKPSVVRLISWLIGLSALFYVTSGGVAVYGKVQFSTHMVDHMSLTMIVPIFLVLGTIFMGLATPTEAGALGVVGAMVLAALNRRLTWPLISEAMTTTATLTASRLA